MNIFGHEFSQLRLRAGVVVVTTMSMLAVLIPNSAAPASAADVDLSQTVHPKVASALWSQYSGKNAGGSAPRSVIDLAPGGTAIWGAALTAGSNSLTAPALVISGLPAGFSVAPARGVPSAVADKDGHASSCRNAGGTFTCQIAGTINPGKTVYTPLAITAHALKSGTKAEASVLVYDNGSPVGGSTTFGARVKKGAKDVIDISVDGQSLSRTGSLQSRQIHFYNLGGAKARPSSAKRHLELHNVLPSRLAIRSKIKGAGWKCAASGKGVDDCAWTGKNFEVGQSASILTTDYKIPANAHKGIKKAGGAYKIAWTMALTESAGHVAQKHPLVVQVLPPTKPVTQKKTPPRKASLTIKASALGHPRLGGIGRYRVTVNNGGGVSATKVKVQVNAPGHARIAKNNSKAAWNCTAAGLCTLKAKSIKSHQGVPPIDVTLRSHATHNVGSHFIAKASWVQLGGKLRGTNKSRVDGKWDPVIQVADRASTKKIRSKASAPGVLNARVNGTNGRRFEYRWRQICPKDIAGITCKKAQILGSAKAMSEKTDIAQNFKAPVVNKNSKLAFELRIRAGGAVITKRYVVTVKPAIKQRLNPRLKTSQYRQNSYQPLRDRSKPVIGDVSAVAQVQIAKAGGITDVTAAKKVTLKANVKVLKRNEVARVQKPVKWRVISGPANLLKHAKTIDRGRKITFKIPKSQLTPVVVAAVVKHKGKRATAVSEILRPKTSVAKLVSIKGEVTAMATNAYFCQLYSSAQANTLNQAVTGPVTVSWTQASASGTNCSDPGAAINFQNGSTTINGVAFSGLNGVITASAGLAISSGTAVIPGDNTIPAGLRTINFTMPPGESLLTAGFNGDALAALTGSISTKSFPLLPLPVSWGVSTGTLTFTAQPGNGYQVGVNVSATGPGSGAVTVAGAITSTGGYSLSVTMANLWTLTATNGSTATFSGSGSVSYTPGGSNVYNITANMVTSGGFQLVNAISLSSASVSWGASGFTANVSGAIAMAGSSYTFALKGQITDFRNWSLNLTSDYSPITMHYMSVDNIGGTIAMSTGKRGHAHLAITVSAQAHVFPYANIPATVTVNSATFNLLLYCGNSPMTASQICATTPVLGAELDITGAITVFNSGQVPLQTTAAVDLTTFEFTIQSTVNAGSGFGPKDMNFTNVQFFVSNDPQSEPLLANNPCMTDSLLSVQHLVVGAVADYTLTNGFKGEGVLVYNSAAKDNDGYSGFCFADTAFNQDIGSIIAAQGFSFGNTGTLIFSTFATTLQVDGQPQIITPSTVTIVDSLTFPSFLASTLGVGGVEAMVTIGFSPTVNFAVEGDVDFSNDYLVGSSNPNSTSLQWARAGMFIDKETSGILNIGFDIGLTLTTPASPDSTAAGSQVQSAQIPLQGTLALSFFPSGGGPQLTLRIQMGDDGPPWDNAFGISGLDLNELVVQGSVDPEVPEASSFGAGVNITTPPAGSDTTFGNLTSMLGIQPGVNMSIAFNVSALQPCYEIQIGDPTGGQLAIDWGGVIEADYVEILFAPNGCPVQVSNTLPTSGYAFAFDGSILGTTTNISGDFMMGPGKLVSGNFNVTIGSFSFAGVDVQQTNVQLAFATYPSQYLDISFSGGINIWGAVLVNVSGTINVDLGTVQNSLQVDVNGSYSETLLGIYKENLAFSFDADFEIPTGAAPYFKTLDVNAQGGIKVLILEANLSVGFDYSNGVVNRMYAIFGVGVDLWVASIGAQAKLDYERPASGGDGAVNINVEGTIRWWLFGWHSDTVSLFNTSIPVDLSNPNYSAPQPVSYGNPAPPQSEWPHLQWSYSDTMFMGIPWDNTQLAAAAGIPVGQLQAIDFSQVVNGDGQANGLFTNGGVTIGKTTSTSDSYNTVTGTVTLPPSETYSDLAAQAAHLPARLIPASFTNSTCKNGGPQTFTIKVPQFNGTTPADQTNASIVLAELNWRMYLSWLVEQGSIAGQGTVQALNHFKCGYDVFNNYQDLSDWVNTNNQGMQFNLGYPVSPVPQQVDAMFCRNGAATGQYGQTCADHLNNDLGGPAGPWGQGWGLQGAPDPDGPPPVPTPTATPSSFS